MANNEAFSAKDIAQTEAFIEKCKAHIGGSKVMDICGGLGRNSGWLSKFFNTIDVQDLYPQWGSTPPEKRGRLIQANLKDLKEHVTWGEYNCVFGCWALCYISYANIKDLLATIWSSLDDDGSFILKEPILSKKETTPRLCTTG